MSAAVAERLDEKADAVEARTCESGIITFVFGIEHGRVACGKLATHSVLRLCCGATRYVCTEHAGSAAPGLAGTMCTHCGHRCPQGVCDCRVVMPL